MEGGRSDTNLVKCTNFMQAMITVDVYGELFGLKL